MYRCESNLHLLWKVFLPTSVDSSSLIYILTMHCVPNICSLPNICFVDISKLKIQNSIFDKSAACLSSSNAYDKYRGRRIESYNCLFYMLTIFNFQEKTNDHRLKLQEANDSKKPSFLTAAVCFMKSFIRQPLLLLLYHFERNQNNLAIVIALCLTVHHFVTRRAIS